ncbi:MAG: Hsp70 family protein [Candidatus Hydrogenedentes bacterium]|nr:Hsp70 family protein [Candidatus Hydrogenedentota bacterium]
MHTHRDSVRGWRPGQAVIRAHRNEEVTGESIAGVLVCVPACFNDQQRRASLEVVEQATFRPLGTINEPSAAVIAVAKGKNGVYVIVDIGAGTTDVSVVRSEDDGHTITILATAGRDDRGGREVTSRIVEYCLDYASQHGVALDPEEDSRDIVIIESEAETCKQDLSSRDSVTLTIRAKDKLLDIPLTLSAFNQLIADLCQDILALVDEALSQAQITPDEVDGVASVGGGSRVRYLRENIEVKFGSAKAMKDFDVDKCVVMGAVDAIAIKVQERIAVGDVALQGMAPEYQLKGNVVLREVLGQALGVLAVNTRTMREQLAAMIPQGTALPATASTTFGLIGGAEGVDSADIVVLQGKANCDPSDATELARFPLHDLPAGPTDERVRVELDVDTSALASVRAVDTFSGKEIQGQAHTAAAVTKSHLG